MTVLASDEGVLGVFAVADTLRPEARDAVAALHLKGIQTRAAVGRQTIAWRKAWHNRPACSRRTGNSCHKTS